MKKSVQNHSIARQKMRTISVQKTLIKLLSENQISDIEKIYGIYPYEKIYDRHGIVVDVKERDSEERIRIMIDLKVGQPTVFQVHDALYTIGADCLKKVILYTGDENKNDNGDPSADLHIVDALVDKLLDLPLGLYFFKLEEDRFIVEEGLKWKNHERHGKIEINNMPARKEFMSAVFWDVFFDYINEQQLPDIEWGEPFEGRFKKKEINNRKVLDFAHNEYISSCFLIEWYDYGVRGLLKVEDETNSSELIEKVQNFEQEIEEEHDMQIELLPDEPRKVYINFSDKPFDWIYTANSGEILNFAYWIWFDAIAVVTTIIDICDEVFTERDKVA